MMRNLKALSPVVASIILIAVTVAVSVVVAAWMGGMSVGMMGNAQQGSITNVYFNGGNSVAVTISNTGQAQMNFTAAYFNGLVVNPAPAFINQGIAKGGVQTYTFTTPYVSGTAYDIKFTTTKGNNIESTFNAP